MTTYTDAASFFQKKGPEDIERFIDKNLDISQQVSHLLDERGWTQKELAKRIGKTEGEISKWLSGSHNLTLKSIAKLEAILASDIILTPIKASQKFQKVQYITLKLTGHTNDSIPEERSYETNVVDTELSSPVDDQPSFSLVA